MEEAKKITFLDTSLFIGFLTLLGYAIAFVFQLPQANYYGIPYYFIEIKPENIFFITFILSSMVISLSPYLNMFKRNRIVENKYMSQLRFLLAVYLVLISFMLFSGFPYLNIIYWSFCMLSVILLEIVLPLFCGRGIKGWKQKLKSADAAICRYVRTDKKNVIENTLLKISIVPKECIFIFALFVYLAYISGFYYVRFKMNYYVLNTTPTMLLVTKYGDTMFAVSFDPVTLVFSPELNMFDKDYILDNKIKLEYKKVGNLIQPNILIGK